VRRIVFPLEGNLYGRSISTVAPPHRFLPGAKGGLYAWAQVRQYPEVILVEGLFDCAILWEAGFHNVMGQRFGHEQARTGGCRACSPTPALQAHAEPYPCCRGWHESCGCSCDCAANCARDRVNHGAGVCDLRRPTVGCGSQEPSGPMGNEYSHCREVEGVQDRRYRPRRRVGVDGVYSADHAKQIARAETEAEDNGTIVTEYSRAPADPASPGGDVWPPIGAALLCGPRQAAEADG
jgi:hypothetical protein